MLCDTRTPWTHTQEPSHTHSTSSIAAVVQLVWVARILVEKYYIPPLSSSI